MMRSDVKTEINVYSIVEVGGVNEDINRTGSHLCMSHVTGIESLRSHRKGVKT